MNQASRPRSRVPSTAPILLQIVVGLLAAGILYVGFTLPPKAVRLTLAPPVEPVAYGGYHLHSNRSDGTGNPDDIAAAASRAGLQFIIVTDHGDAARPPDPPQYRHGVLYIDAVEINTTAGHVVALGLDRASPYPLAGEARDVIDDIHRMGGRAIVAHPDSPKPALRWRAWNVDYDGIEWLNADSEWRDETAPRLAGAAARYLLRSPETIVSLFDRPGRTLQRWDAAAVRRAVVGLAALDAHARLAWSDADESRPSRTVLARPNYAEMFRTVAQAVILDRPLSGAGPADAAAILGAIAAGRTFSVVAAIASPGQLSFTAERAGVVASMGQSLPRAAEPTRLRAVVAGAPNARVVLLHNGAPLRSGSGAVEAIEPLAEGEYRVEAYYPGHALPWIVSNPIYIGVGEPVARQPLRPPAASPVPLRFVDLPGDDGWNVNKDRSSTGDTIRDGRAVTFIYRLGPGAPAGQFAAVVTSLDPALREEGFDRVRFTVRADRPMRISVQLRLPGGRDGQRWRRSVYVDDTARTLEVSLQDFMPVEPTSQRPLVAHIMTVLFVVDTVNSSPGTRGRVWVSDVALGSPSRTAIQ